jgi:hypothetical protein
MNRVALVGFLAILSACSSEENSRSRSNSGGGGGSGGKSVDSGGAAGTGGQGKAGSSGGGAGGQGKAGSSGAPDDAGTCAPVAPGPDVSDVSLRARDIVTYAGPVDVEAGDGGSLTLVPVQDGGRHGVRFDGMVPSLSPGATLWANFREADPMRTNPFAPRRVWHHVVKASETGPILAEDLKDFMDRASSLTFLGAPIDLEKLCSLDPRPPVEENGFHISSGCLGVSQYAVTIHGETDLRLTDHTSGHISVGGIDYTVSVNGAWENYFTMDHSDWCIPDDDISPGLSLVARATHYDDALSGGDGGAAGALTGTWYGTGPDGDECVAVCPNGKVFTGDRPCTDLTSGDFSKYLAYTASGTSLTVSGSPQCWLATGRCGSPSTMTWTVNGDSADVSWCGLELQLHRTNDSLTALCDDPARGPC